MLKIQVGEGMWAALSSKEQNERVFQLKVEEEKLRKDGKLDLASTRLPGSKHDTGFSLLSLMDESLAEMEVREEQIKEKMKESGMYEYYFEIYLQTNTAKMPCVYTELAAPSQNFCLWKCTAEILSKGTPGKCITLPHNEKVSLLHGLLCDCKDM